NRRADEFEAAAGELLGNGARDRRLGWHLLDGAEVVACRLAVDEVPEEARETRSLLHHFLPGLRRLDRALDLEAIAPDAGIGQQPFNLLWRVTRDLDGVEIVKGTAEILALAQDRDPRQPGLEAIEHELLVERPVVEFRHAPFFVVVSDVKRILPGPRTTD